MKLIDILIINFIFFITSILLHIIVCWISPSRHFMLKGLIIGAVSTILLGIYLHYEYTLNFVGLYIFGAFWLFYLMVHINLLNSATLKMLEFLYNRSDSLKSEDFKKVFNENDGLETRLLSMKQSGFIDYNGETIRTTKKSQILLSIIFFIRRILSIDQIG